MAPPQPGKPNWFVDTPERLRMFDPSLFRFADWRVKFEEFLRERDITDDADVKPLLLKALPQGQLKVLSPVCSPRDPEEMPVRFILDRLQVHFDRLALKSRLSARCEFFSMKQNGRSFDEFAKSLTSAAFPCDFRQFEAEAILTEFVMGLDNPILRKYLLKNEITDLGEAIEISHMIHHLLPKEGK